MYGVTNRVNNSGNYSSVSRINSTQTSKGRPTVADAFRFQLTSLVDLLHSTNPWYVRCIKPNMIKASNYYDDEQVRTQLHYLGMLDIIRIRREGFPIHFLISQFVLRYRCLVRKIVYLPNTTTSETAAKILIALKMPKTEWQIGKTRIFLRPTVHEPLEEKRKFLYNQMAVIVQKRWKGFITQRKYLQMKAAAIIIQQNFLGHRQRLRYLRMRRAAITLQAFVRGMFAREVASAMKQMKKVEEEMRRKEQEEAEKKLLEERKRLIQQEQANQKTTGIAIDESLM